MKLFILFIIGMILTIGVISCVAILMINRTRRKQEPKYPTHDGKYLLPKSTIDIIDETVYNFLSQCRDNNVDVPSKFHERINELKGSLYPSLKNMARNDSAIGLNIDRINAHLEKDETSKAKNLFIELFNMHLNLNHNTGKYGKYYV